jgi:hypothetical protein
VIDAVSGAIYVIGGYGTGTTYYKDVWASTDGGARPDSVGGVAGFCILDGYAAGNSRQYSGYHRGVPQGYLGVLKGTKPGYLGGT